ncbi:hypothetical protein GTP45_01195 [Pseudoduganella sp. FT55W]|uniref:Uncharacterized protein n=1 Tax=Duganella rivi TaxID=2666083 RepID=A0A7X4GL56_9BURK|nr:hypothetical protein [Duganella rivi]MYM65448.1 hypothetical protein [Duganella rivi]
MTHITHPTVFNVDGVKFQVTALTQLTDQEAAKIVRRFIAGRKFTKKDIGKTIQVVTLFDQESIGLL